MMTNRTRAGRWAWAAFTAAALFFLYEFVARVAPSLAPEAIARKFGLGSTGFSTLSSLFFWVYAPMQIIVGLALDRLGARRLLVPAIAVCACGMALFSLAPTVVLAGIGRMMTGLGASFGFVGALYVVNHRFPPRLFALLSGVVNALGMLGTAIGAVWLSETVQALGWQPVFLGIALAGAALFLFALLALHDGDDAPEVHPDPHPLAPLKPLLRDGRVWLIAVLGALYYMPVNVYGGLWGKAQILQDRGLGDSAAELAVSMIFWGMAAGSIGAGALSDRLGHRKALLVLGALLTTLCYAAALFLPGLGLVTLSGLLFLAGLFNGAQMLTFAMAKEGHRAEVSGTVIAFVNMIGIGGALIFQPLVGLLLDASGGVYGPAMMTIPGCTLLAALMALVLRDKVHPDHAIDPS
ncbi:MFS transporter [Pseudooceanicola sp. CBS1P-1]|nr:MULTISPECIES: MFS transporter [Pseudooceanicola]MBT9383857.1 MFS transporter [Pseudooceanicola endophyticus]